MLTLSHDRTSGNAVSDVAEARVHVQHLGWHGLLLVSLLCVWDNTDRSGRATFEYLQHLKKGVMRTKPTL